jgi:MerR family transcriptional regulator, heat shock protein HspR
MLVNLLDRAWASELFLSLIDSTYLLMYNELMSLSSGPEGRFGTNPDHGLYPISVVSELTGLSPHILRAYERAGLLAPTRTDGGTRRYSDNDLARLRRITLLADDRVNLAGIRRIIELEAELAALRAEIAGLRAAEDT